uniref:Peptidase S1 domain-containing protein n=1 Tax=Clastoptera arizonana TaxID=38151 RepID=A0A1B6CPS9_9HEMI
MCRNLEMNIIRCLSRNVEVTWFWILILGFHSSSASVSLKTSDNKELALKYNSLITSKTTKQPYLVTIYYNDIYFCSGAVLANKWVLTTSSCVWGHNYAKKLTIRAKSDRIDMGGVMYRVAKCILHPDFLFYSTKHNVALLKTSTPMRYGNTLQPIALAKRSLVAGDTGIVSGWGLSKERKGVKILQALNVSVAEVNECSQSYLEYTRMLFCNRTEEEEPCWDDEANPVVQKYQLYGLTSFIISCSGAKYPVRFTDVAELRLWIRSTMKESMP